MPELKTRPSTAANATRQPAGALWQVRLFGGFSLDDDQQQLTRLRSRAAMLLLARLALAPARAHSREELATLLWPDATEPVGRSRLRQTLSYLKSLLEPPGGPLVVIADRRVVRVTPDALWCDALVFEQAQRAGRHAEALALYRGELLPGFYDEWVHDERQRFQALAERLGDAPLAPTAAPPAARPQPVPARPHEMRLPQYLTRLIGADVSGARLRGMLLEHRFVSLLGPGGSGKTRLAVEVARLMCEAEPSGDTPPFERALFVSLVACVTATQVLDQLLLSLRISSSGDPFAQLLGALDGQTLLVVLDNCEQLDDAAVARIAELAAQLPRVHWLATSRRPLGLDGEREFMLDALELPSPEASLTEVAMNPAVALFIDRARAHRFEFHATAGNRDSLIALVRWLDGLPLAIELAASRSRTFGPAETLALLNDARNRPGAAALAWLSRRGTRSGADLRHASMLSVIEWSWNLLTPDLQQTLQVVCLLPAGASAAVAAGVPEPGQSLAAAQERLDALVAHSVVQQRIGQDGQARYLASEPVRQYVAALQGAPQARALRGAVRAWALDWAQTMPATPPLATVRDELPNLLTIMNTAVADGHGDDTVRLILTLQVAWGEIAIPAGALDVLYQMLAAPGLDPSLAAGAHALAAWSNFEAGRRELALEHAARALSFEISDEPLRANVLGRVARIRWRVERDPVATRVLIAQALPLARAHGRHNTEAALLSLEAVITTLVDRDAARGKALNDEALALWRRSGNAHLINAGRYNLATSHLHGGRPSEALAELQALADECRELQDWDMVSGALDARGTALSTLRRWDEAARSHREALEVAWSTMELLAAVFALWNLSHALARLRQPVLAAQTMGFAESCWEKRFGNLDDADRRDVKRVRRLVERQLPAAEVQAAWQAGRERSLAQAVRAVLDA